MSISADDPRPPRVQMAAALRAEIQDGRLPVSKRLPSIRDFAERFGVSPNTAQAAVDILKAEGLLVSHGNRGLFVADPAETAEEHAGSPEYIAITRRLDSVDEAVRSMAEWLQQLQNEVRSGRAQAQSPTAKRQ